MQWVFCLRQHRQLSNQHVDSWLCIDQLYNQCSAVRGHQATFLPETSNAPIQKRSDKFLVIAFALAIEKLYDWRHNCTPKLVKCSCHVTLNCSRLGHFLMNNSVKHQFCRLSIKFLKLEWICHHRILYQSG